MEFSDNLKRIRKENNLSQEQFAERLGVSRQAVSKWESGQSYPEMDKVIQICKLYNFNIDELLNQNVKQINEDIDSKKNMNKYIEGFLSYISKTVNMFCAMKFKQKVKCLFEQFIIFIVLLIIFSIIGGIGGTIVDNILDLFPRQAYRIIYSIFETLYVVLAIAAGTTIFLYLFKIRYLDYYKVVKREEKSNEDNIKEEISKDNTSEGSVLELPKSEKIIFRDPSDSQFKFITAIVKAVVFCMKIAVGFMAFWFIFSFIGIIATIILSFLIKGSGALFIGVLITLVASGVINYVILEICYNFIVNRKASKLRIGLMFIISLIVLGIGIGVTTIGVYNINIVEDKEIEYKNQKELEVDMSDELFIVNHEEIEYITDDRENVKIVVDYPDYYDINIDYHEYKEEIYVVIHDYQDGKLFLENIKNIVKDLNNKEIRTYQEYKITVYASEDNIKKLKENY